MKKRPEPKPPVPIAATPSLVVDSTLPIYLPSGPFAEFHKLTRPHHLAQEHAQARDDAEPLAPPDPYALDDPP